MQQTVLNVQGMTCGHCVRTVESTLKTLTGVAAVTVDLKGATAAVQFEPAQASVPAMIAALADAGYDATST